MLAAPRGMLAPAAMALLLLAAGSANLAHGARGIVVDTVRPERRHLATVVSLDATIEPHRAVVIGAPAVGRVSEVVVRAGDRVEAGQLVVRLDSIDAAAQLDAATAALGAIDAERRTALARLRRARAQLGVAAARQERATRLRDAGLNTEVDLDAAVAAWRLATDDVTFAELEVVEHDQRRVRQRHVVDSLQHALDTLSIRAPIGGRVAEVLVAAGDMVVPAVRPGSGGALIVIHDDSGFQAAAHVNADTLLLLAVGQPAWVTLAAFPSAPIAGTVASLGLVPVANGSAPGEPRYRVAVAISDAARARPGQTGTVSIVTAERRNVPSIPRHIVSTDPATGSRAVFAVKNGRAHLTPVILGIADATHVEILWARQATWRSLPGRSRRHDD